MELKWTLVATLIALLLVGACEAWGDGCETPGCSLDPCPYAGPPAAPETAPKHLPDGPPQPYAPDLITRTDARILKPYRWRQDGEYGPYLKEPGRPAVWEHEERRERSVLS